MKAGEMMATLKDVARASGLTVGTVSRVLNNRGYISEQTRNRVYEVMKELNYQPNEMARSLSKQSSNTIGVIVPHVMHPYFAKLISNLERAAYRHNYKILLFNSRGKEEREDEYLDMCKSNRVAGIILCSGTIETEKFQNMGIPFVTMERFIGGGSASVECDSFQGGCLAAEHLIKKGCKNILHFGGMEDHPMPADKRWAGFESVCKREGVECSIVVLPKWTYEELEYETVVSKALDEYPEIDGVFASSDVIAAYVIRMCAQRGIRVPEDIKVVGFDDVLIAQMTTPAITTIRQPVKEMAEAAVSALEQIKEGKMVPARSVFPVSIVEREST